ncbi:malonate decarboxylase holo-[acyl-carrier-protein] synthase [Bordetella genomosp. 11]|nr:malonate decarboxylase holo-[acyl-carrier-protein] synthase [Bordetella genomosp. 11]
MTPPSPPREAWRQRHALVYLHPQAWSSLLRDQAWLARHALSHTWAARGWPLIARRRSAHETDGVAVGLPFPPSAGKARIALRVRERDIARVAGLPALEQAISTAPAAWHQHLYTLVRIAADHEIFVQVFGSLAWQHLTGLSYVTDESDLDLAWSAPRGPRLASLLDAVARTDAAAPMRVDGEVIFADGTAANWRELRGDASQVILKTPAGLALASRAQVAHMLEP